MPRKKTHEVLVPFGSKKIGDKVYFTNKHSQTRFEDMGYVVAIGKKAITSEKQLKQAVEDKSLKNDTETK